MPGVITMPIIPSNPLPKESLQTLLEITQYVDSERFTPTGLASGLGQDEKRLAPRLDWLVENGYLERFSGCCLKVTRKGWAYEEVPPEDADSDLA